MAHIVGQAVTSAGTALSPVAASGGGDTIPYGTMAIIANTSGTPRTVTVVTPGNVDGLAIADRDVEIDPNGSVAIKPTRVYRNPTNGYVSLAYSDETDVTLTVLSFS